MRELVLDQLETYKELRTRVNLKTTLYKHTSRIELIHRTYVNYANPTHYEYKICQRCDIALQYFEIKKEYVYEQRYRSKCLVIYTVDSRKNKIDEQLK